MIGDFVFGYYYIHQMIRYIECITRAKHDINAQVLGVVLREEMLLLCVTVMWLVFKGHHLSHIFVRL